jgi:hypothetical protein
MQPEVCLGQPTVLGSGHLMFIFSFQAIQILLSLVIVGFGNILALNFTFSSKEFPLVILTGYPFWGAVIVSTIC